MHQLRKVRTQIKTQISNRLRTRLENRFGADASWPFLAAGFLSQACPGAAPLFHSCAMLVSLRKTRRPEELSGQKS